MINLFKKSARLKSDKKTILTRSALAGGCSIACPSLHATVVESADTLDLKSSEGNLVPVQVWSVAPLHILYVCSQSTDFPIKLPLALVLEVPVAVNDCVRPMICGLAVGRAVNK